MSLNPKLDDLISRLKQVTRNGNGWEACCPAHDDRRPSLSIAESDDGKILLTCHSNGCVPANIMQCCGLFASDLFPPKQSSGKAEWGDLVKTYEYQDENRAALFEVCRFEKAEILPDKTVRTIKTFRQRHKVAGEWVWKMTGVRRVLYRLPQILAAPLDEPIWIVEGEKQVEYLVSRGLHATCNPQGAGKWQDEFAECLRGRTVIIIPDNDPLTEKKGAVHCVGKEHAESVADSLSGKAKEVYVFTLPDCEEKWGLDDWLQKGNHDLDELEEIAENALPWIFGSKLFDRTPTKPEAPLDPYAAHKDVVEAIQIDVLGETETGHVLLYSRFHKKTTTLASADVGKLQLPRLVQFAGPPAAERCYIGKDACPESCVSISDVRLAICMLAGRRQIEESLHGSGVWPCGNDLVLVSRGEVVTVNGHLERVESAEVRGNVFDLNDVARPWFSFDELNVAWAASENPDWFRSVIKQAERLFGQWSYASEGAETLLTGLVMATWIQAAWKWRPQVFILGESNTGKTTLFHALAGAEHSGEKGLFGSLALKFANYTAAGLSQSIGRSAKIVICDEFEQSKAREEVLTMVRAAGRGDPVVRGTTGHRSKSFRLHQMFWMGSTESGLNKEVDQNRFIRIQLVRTSDAAKWQAFRLPSDRDLQRLGLELLVCILRHRARAVALAEALYRAKPPGINDRICESYAVPTAAISAVTGKTDEEAFELYVELLKITEPGEVEKAQTQVMEDILNSLVDCGRGIKKTVSEIVASCLPGGGYISAETEAALNANGVMVCQQDSREGSSPWGVFVAPKIVLRSLLKDTEWRRTRIGEHLIRFKGAEKSKKRINGSHPWGYWVPVSSIETLAGDATP